MTIFNFLKKPTLSGHVAQIAALSLLAAIALSKLLWFPAGRTFPLLPVADWLALPGAVGQVLPGGLLVAALLAVVFFPEKKWTLPALLAAMALALAFDLTRFQVWFWFFALVLASVAMARRAGEEAALDAVRWVVAAVYFWSGVQKFSPYFAEDVFPWFVQAFDWSVGLGSKKWAAWAMAFGEAALGVGLLVGRTRAFFRWVALVFHATILLILSPIGHSWNYVVFPWNFGMAAIVWLVFSKNAGFSFKKNYLLTGIVAVAWLAPVLRFGELAHENMAWKMYCGSNPEGTFFFNNDLKIQLPPRVAEEVFGGKEKRLIIDDWTFYEMDVAVAPSEKYYRAIGRKLCPCVADQSKAGIFFLKVNAFDKSKERMKRIHCQELMPRLRNF